jgi:uncharacterized protein
MCLEIRKIPEGGQVLEMNLQLGECDVALTLKMQRNREKISCVAEYKTKIICECSRCLEEFEQEISGKVEFWIVPEGQDGGSDEIDRYFYRGENTKVDFTQTIYDEVFTQIPMKPLCKEDCKGIELS